MSVQENNGRNEKLNVSEEGETLLMTTMVDYEYQSSYTYNREKMDMDVNVGTGAKKLPQYIAASAVNIAAITAGIALGWPSPSIAKLKDINETPLSFAIDKEQESWVGSLIALGAALGPLPAGIGCDKMGRKLTLLMATAPFIVSWFIISTTTSLTQLYAARFLLGTGVGAIFTALPMYIGEIADNSVRGALGSFMQLFITVGLLLAYAIGPFVSFFWFSIVCFILPVAFVCVFILFPDSPTYLIAAGRIDEARESLKKLRGLEGQILEKELTIIQDSVEEAMKNKGSFKDIIKNKGNLRALLLSLGLVAGQQLAGINVVLFYTQNIFDATGSAMSPEISAIIIGIVQVLSSSLTPLVVERLGRKLLLLISAAGMCLSLVVLGVFFYLKTSGNDVESISFLPVVSLVVYMIVYCVGFGPLPWAVMGELFPANIKSAASTATASFCWFVGFLITKFFSNIESVIGMAGAFWIFAGFCVLAGLFVLKFLPETKGKSLQEIQDILNGNSSDNS